MHVIENRKVLVVAAPSPGEMQIKFVKCLKRFELHLLQA